MLMAVIVLLSLSGIVQAGQVLHYDFSEGSGTTLTDLSGNGNDAAIIGATWAGGKLNFDGSGDYLDPGKTVSELGLTGNLSFAALVHFNTPLPNVDTNYTLFDNLNWNTSGQVLRIEGTAFALKYVKCNEPWGPGNGGYYEKRPAESINLTNDTTYHIGFVIDGYNLKFYIDGSLVADASVGETFAPNSLPLTISAISQSFQGQMMDVQFYNNALTGTEMLDLYNTTGVVPEPGTILAALSILGPAAMIFKRRK